MNRSARNLLFSLFFLIPLLASADEQQKAHKILNKITAMATDPAGKRGVNLAMSQSLSIGRTELVQRRRTMNASYGEVFVAYKLTQSGSVMDDITAKMRAGKTIWQIADEARLDWKQIAAEAKKLSGRVDANLLAHFSNKKSEIEREKADAYNPFLDTVKADSNVSQQEIEDAQARYIFLRDHAIAVSDSALNTSAEKSAQMVRTDPLRTDARAGPSTGSGPPSH